MEKHEYIELSIFCALLVRENIDPGDTNALMRIREASVGITRVLLRDETISPRWESYSEAQAREAMRQNREVAILAAMNTQNVYNITGGEEAINAFTQVMQNNSVIPVNTSTQYPVTMEEAFTQPTTPTPAVRRQRGSQPRRPRSDAVRVVIEDDVPIPGHAESLTKDEEDFINKAMSGEIQSVPMNPEYDPNTPEGYEDAEIEILE